MTYKFKPVMMMITNCWKILQYKQTNWALQDNESIIKGTTLSWHNTVSLAKEYEKRILQWAVNSTDRGWKRWRMDKSGRLYKLKVRETKWKKSERREDRA